MSIFDTDIAGSVSDFISKGTEAATRGVDTASLKIKQTEAQRQRESACAALGASLFEATRGNAELRGPREELFAAVEAADVKLAEIETQIAQIEAERAAAAAAAASAVPQPKFCTNCGKPVIPGAKFCSECGASLS